MFEGCFSFGFNGLKGKLKWVCILRGLPVVYPKFYFIVVQEKGILLASYKIHLQQFIQNLTPHFSPDGRNLIKGNPLTW